jgi:hypothetical protein
MATVVGDGGDPSPSPSSSPPPSSSGPGSGGIDPNNPDAPTDGKAPDFEAIYAYAAMFIDLGDAIWEYAHNAIGDGFNAVQWDGDRESAAIEAMETIKPLITLLASSDQHAKVPSASRVLWNIGEQINWFAINLEEQRKEESKNMLAEILGFLFGLLFLGLFAGLAFLPATAAFMARMMSILGDVIAGIFETLWAGTEWLGTLGRGLGDAIVGAALSVGPQLATQKIADSIAGVNFKIDPKGIIFGALTGAGGGIIFGSDIRGAAASAAAAKAAAKASGGPIGVGAPKPGPRALPGGAPKEDNIGGLPNAGTPRPDGLPGIGGVRAPAVGGNGLRAGPGSKVPGIRDQIGFVRRGDGLGDIVNRLTQGGPRSDGAPGPVEGLARDGGPAVPDPPGLTPPGRGIDGQHGIQRPDTSPLGRADTATGGGPNFGPRSNSDGVPIPAIRPVGESLPGDRPGGNVAQPHTNRPLESRRVTGDASARPLGSTADERFANLQRQLDLTRAESGPRPGEQPPAVSRSGEGPRPGEQPSATQRSLVRAGDEHQILASKFPGAPTAKPLGMKEIEAGLAKAGNDADAAGLSPRYVQALSERVQAAIDNGSVHDAARQLTTMRDQVDRSQVGRRLDSFREHVDGGHQRAAEMGMDKATWLKKAAAIEKAAAEGRLGDVHELLKDYEKLAGEHVRSLRVQQEQLPAEEVKPGGFRKVSQDSVDSGQTFKRLGSEPGDRSVPRVDDLRDWMTNMRSERVDQARLTARDKISTKAVDDLAAKAADVDKRLWADHEPAESRLGKLGEKIYPQVDRDAAKIDSLHKAIDKVEYRAKVQALRDGDSPLPQDEIKHWQKGLDGFKRLPIHEQKFMEYYDQRLQAYRAETQSEIAESLFAPDRSRPLNDRLDEQLAQISKEVRDQVAGAHSGSRPGRSDSVDSWSASETSTLVDRPGTPAERPGSRGSDLPETGSRADRSPTSSLDDDALSYAEAPPAEIRPLRATVNAGAETADPYSQLHAEREIAQAAPDRMADTHALRDQYESLVKNQDGHAAEPKSETKPDSQPRSTSRSLGYVKPRRTEILEYWRRKRAGHPDQSQAHAAIAKEQQDSNDWVRAKYPDAIREKLLDENITERERQQLSDTFGLPEIAYEHSRNSGFARGALVHFVEKYRAAVRDEARAKTSIELKAARAKADTERKTALQNALSDLSQRGYETPSRAEIDDFWINRRAAHPDQSQAHAAIAKEQKDGKDWVRGNYPRDIQQKLQDVGLTRVERQQLSDELGLPEIVYEYHRNGPDSALRAVDHFIEKHRETAQAKIADERYAAWLKAKDGQSPQSAGMYLPPGRQEILDHWRQARAEHPDQSRASDDIAVERVASNTWVRERYPDDIRAKLTSKDLTEQERQQLSDKLGLPEVAYEHHRNSGQAHDALRHFVDKYRTEVRVETRAKADFEHRAAQLKAVSDLSRTRHGDYQVPERQEVAGYWAAKRAEHPDESHASDVIASELKASNDWVRENYPDDIRAKLSDENLTGAERQRLADELGMPEIAYEHHRYGPGFAHDAMDYFVRWHRDQVQAGAVGEQHAAWLKTLRDESPQRVGVYAGPTRQEVTGYWAAKRAEHPDESRASDVVANERKVSDEWARENYPDDIRTKLSDDKLTEQERQQLSKKLGLPEIAYEHHRNGPDLAHDALNHFVEKYRADIRQEARAKADAQQREAWGRAQQEHREAVILDRLERGATHEYPDPQVVAAKAEERIRQAAEEKAKNSIVRKPEPRPTPDPGSPQRVGVYARVPRRTMADYWDRQALSRVTHPGEVGARFKAVEAEQDAARNWARENYPEDIRQKFEDQRLTGAERGKLEDRLGLSEVGYERHANGPNFARDAVDHFVEKYRAEVRKEADAQSRKAVEDRRQAAIREGAEKGRGKIADAGPGVIRNKPYGPVDRGIVLKDAEHRLGANAGNGGVPGAKPAPKAKPAGNKKGLNYSKMKPSRTQVEAHWRTMGERDTAFPDVLQAAHDEVRGWQKSANDWVRQNLPEDIRIKIQDARAKAADEGLTDRARAVADRNRRQLEDQVGLPETAYEYDLARARQEAAGRDTLDERVPRAAMEHFVAKYRNDVRIEEQRLAEIKRQADVRKQNAALKKAGAGQRKDGRQNRPVVHRRQVEVKDVGGRPRMLGQKGKGPVDQVGVPEPKAGKMAERTAVAQKRVAHVAAQGRKSVTFRKGAAAAKNLVKNGISWKGIVRKKPDPAPKAEPVARPKSKPTPDPGSPQRVGVYARVPRRTMADYWDRQALSRVTHPGEVGARFKAVEAEQDAARNWARENYPEDIRQKFEDQRLTGAERGKLEDRLGLSEVGYERHANGPNFARDAVDHFVEKYRAEVRKEADAQSRKAVEDRRQAAIREGAEKGRGKIADAGPGVIRNKPYGPVDRGIVLKDAEHRLGANAGKSGKPGIAGRKPGPDAASAGAKKKFDYAKAKPSRAQVEEYWRAMGERDTVDADALSAARAEVGAAQKTANDWVRENLPEDIRLKVQEARAKAADEGLTDRQKADADRARRDLESRIGLPEIAYEFHRSGPARAAMEHFVAKFRTEMRLEQEQAAEIKRQADIKRAAENQRRAATGEPGRQPESQQPTEFGGHDDLPRGFRWQRAGTGEAGYAEPDLTTIQEHWRSQIKSDPRDPSVVRKSRADVSAKRQNVTKEAYELYPQRLRDWVEKEPPGSARKDREDAIGLNRTAFVLDKAGAEEAGKVAGIYARRWDDAVARNAQRRVDNQRRHALDRTHPDDLPADARSGPARDHRSPEIRDTSVQPAQLPPSRNVFRAKGDTIELVALVKRSTPFPGEGRTIGGDERFQGTEASAAQPDDGYIYFTVDPKTGAPTLSHVRQDELIQETRPATGGSDGEVIGVGRVGQVSSGRTSNVIVFDGKESTFDVHAIRHLQPGERVPVPDARTGAGEEVQFLRNGKDGMALLTFKRDPLRVVPGEVDRIDPDFTYLRLDSGTGHWSNTRLFGTPRVEPVVSAKGDVAHGVLIRDENGRWKPVRPPEAGEKLDAPTPSVSYFRQSPDGHLALRPAAIKDSASDLRFIRVRTDGQVGAGKFAVRSDDRPHLRIDQDDELLNLVPAKLRPDELVVDPKTGDLLVRTTADHKGPSGGGAGHPSGNSERPGGDGGLRLRDATDGANTTTAPPRTIVLRAIPEEDPAVTPTPRREMPTPPEEVVSGRTWGEGGYGGEIGVSRLVGAISRTMQERPTVHVEPSPAETPPGSMTAPGKVSTEAKMTRDENGEPARTGMSPASIAPTAGNAPGHLAGTAAGIAHPQQPAAGSSQTPNPPAVHASAGPAGDLPVGAELIARLLPDVVRAKPANGADVLQSVFDLRFAIGVKLKGATGDMPGAHTGSAWLFDAHDGAGVGWKTVDSSRAVRVAVRTAGVNGMTLFSTYDDAEIATFVHYGTDSVMRVFEVGADGQYQVTHLEDYLIRHALPHAVAPIDHCGEVHA